MAVSMPSKGGKFDHIVQQLYEELGGLGIFLIIFIEEENNGFSARGLIPFQRYLPLYVVNSSIADPTDDLTRRAALLQKEHGAKLVLIGHQDDEGDIQYGWDGPMPETMRKMVVEKVGMLMADESEDDLRKAYKMFTEQN